MKILKEFAKVRRILLNYSTQEDILKKKLKKVKIDLKSLEKEVKSLKGAEKEQAEGLLEETKIILNFESLSRREITEGFYDFQVKDAKRVVENNEEFAKEYRKELKKNGISDEDFLRIVKKKNISTAGAKILLNTYSKDYNFYRKRMSFYSEPKFEVKISKKYLFFSRSPDPIQVLKGKWKNTIYLNPGRKYSRFLLRLAVFHELSHFAFRDFILSSNLSTIFKLDNNKHTVISEGFIADYFVLKTADYQDLLNKIYFKYRFFWLWLRARAELELMKKEDFEKAKKIFTKEGFDEGLAEIEVRGMKSKIRAGMKLAYFCGVIKEIEFEKKYGRKKIDEILKRYGYVRYKLFEKLIRGDL